ncbi:adenosylcobinamide-GDP ribazoletransferase [Streptomyces sp. HB2AG]|uniref:adenosylcobinamide-GDP ribazoletransferase n=1 Tax=Streptomyces sp. HB2AG TaxID=2983400 RepID=UPI0022AAE6F5|nr:adenosylcobinamide-GDP ribazoletransferase [Streptomyces sp. HB2AG]MCZ2524494.1 adenosylcobinamide-GDP ribazoletransferase [Streptomyces sp. HB2AG]
MDSEGTARASAGEGAGRASAGEGMRFAFGTLTVLRVRLTRWDRAAGRAGMLCAPAVGVAVGAASAALGSALLLLGSGPLLAAVASTAVPAALTRGLHLDGLADTADGLGSNKPADEALRIMKASDIGPFGVLTVVLVLLAQVAALAGLYGRGLLAGASAAVVAGAASRLAMTLACRTGVPPARRDGLGAVVAGGVPAGAAAAVAAAVAVLAAAAGAADAVGAVGALPGVLPGALTGAVRGVLAVAAALAAGELLLRRCRARLGGVTGDVFGAVCETAATAALVVSALG